MKLTSKILALSAVAMLVVVLTTLGLHMLTLPQIALFRVWPYYLLPNAEILLCLAVLLAWFRDIIVQYLIWAGTKIHRWLSVLLIVPAISADGLLHFFSIPHIEGWWLPLIGTGITANLISAWVEKHKKLHNRHPASSPSGAVTNGQNYE